MRVPHISLYLGFGGERGNRVDHYQVNRTAIDKIIGNIQRLFAVVRLWHIQIVQIHAEICRVNGVERMLRIDERGYSALLLQFCNDMKRNSGFTRRFGTVNFDNPAFGYSSYSQCNIQRKATRGYDFYIF